jgi:hypothetical protein
VCERGEAGEVRVRFIPAKFRITQVVEVKVGDRLKEGVGEGDVLVLQREPLKTQCRDSEDWNNVGV